MKVYVLEHDDQWYDMGDKYVRGIYATKEAAEASIVTRTPSGRPSKAYGAHTADCCDVEEWDVLAAAQTDIKPDPEPHTGPTAGYVVPESFIEVVKQMVPVRGSLR